MRVLSEVRNSLVGVDSIGRLWMASLPGRISNRPGRSQLCRSLKPEQDPQRSDSHDDLANDVTTGRTPAGSPCARSTKVVSLQARIEDYEARTRRDRPQQSHRRYRDEFARWHWYTYDSRVKSEHPEGHRRGSRERVLDRSGACWPGNRDEGHAEVAERALHACLRRGGIGFHASEHGLVPGQGVHLGQNSKPLIQFH